MGRGREKAAAVYWCGVNWSRAVRYLNTTAFDRRQPRALCQERSSAQAARSYTKAEQTRAKTARNRDKAQQSDAGQVRRVGWDHNEGAVLDVLSPARVGPNCCSFTVRHGQRHGQPQRQSSKES